VGDALFCQTELADDGRLLVVTLHNPPDNAVRPEMLDALDRALADLAADGGPDALVLSARGPVFSKGFDVAVIRSHRDRAAHRAALLAANDVVSRLASCPKPTIAAINGHCLGAGLELALACHFRLCAEKARLGLPELSRGLLPGLGGIDRLARLVGLAKAMELIVLGDMIPADEALRVGLVNRVLPRDGFLDAVLSFARAILGVDQDLVREAIRLSMLSTLRSQPDCIAESISSIVEHCDQPK